MLTPIILIFIFASLSKQLTWSRAGEIMHAMYAHPCGSQSLSLGDLCHVAPQYTLKQGLLLESRSSLIWLIWTDSLLHRTLSPPPKHWDFQWAALPTWYLRGYEGFKLRSSCLYGKCFAHWAISSVPSYILNWKTAFTMETTLSQEVKQKEILKGPEKSFRHSLKTHWFCLVLSKAQESGLGFVNHKFWGHPASNTVHEYMALF